MRKHFRRYLKRSASGGDTISQTIWAFQCLWFAHLAVVAEGWERQHLHDPVIDPLLGCTMRAELRDFRNAIFHPYEYDAKDVGTVAKKIQDFTSWADDLTDGFSRALESRITG